MPFRACLNVSCMHALCCRDLFISLFVCLSLSRDQNCCRPAACLCFWAPPTASTPIRCCWTRRGVVSCWGPGTTSTCSTRTIWPKPPERYATLERAQAKNVQIVGYGMIQTQISRQGKTRPRMNLVRQINSNALFCRYSGHLLHLRACLGRL